MADPIPVTLVTGFLGAGKTTLLSRLLKHPALARTVLLVNEFGEVGLDHLLAEQRADTPVLLESGCICCTIQEDLRATLLRLMPRIESGAIGRVIIETSGLADPVPIMETLIGAPALSLVFKLDAVLVLVDAVYGELALREHPEARRQLALADAILLTKTDLIDTPALRTAIAAINPTAPVITVLNGEADPALLLDLAASRPALPAVAHSHSEVQSFCLTFDEPLRPEGFGHWMQLLIAMHGDKLLRIKGILSLEGQSRPVTLHAVRHLLHPPALLSGWPEGPRQSRLIFVTQGLARETVEQGFRAFKKAAAEAAAGH